MKSSLSLSDFFCSVTSLITPTNRLNSSSGFILAKLISTGVSVELKGFFGNYSLVIDGEEYEIGLHKNGKTEIELLL